MRSIKESVFERESLEKRREGVRQKESDFQGEERAEIQREKS